MKIYWKYFLLSKILTCSIAVFITILLNSGSHAQGIKRTDKAPVALSPDKYYQNPVLAGDYPDPSVLRIGDDYYMTHSSFVYYPGLLIWHSKDLVNWEPVCHALKTNVGSVYAPEFIKYGDMFYIYFPAGGTNWVITAPGPEGPWTEPKDLNIKRLIDPGHVVGQDGRRFLHMDGGNVISLSDDGLSTVGDLAVIYKGWPVPVDWKIEGFSLESPKLTYKNGYYYLTSAQGGTAGPATSHMVVSARSESPFGPWENSPYNPIVHTYHKDEKWHSKGHGTLVEDTEQKWWILYHAYEKDFSTLGRQTLMEPIEWTNDGWFRVPAQIRTDLPVRKPAGSIINHGIVLSDDFSKKELGLHWSFFNEYNPGRYKIVDGRLHLDARGTSPADCAPLLCIPQDRSYEMQVEYQVSEGTVGGLILYYNPKIYAGIATDGSKIITYRRGQSNNSAINTSGNHGFLKIVNIENTVSFYYSMDGKTWEKIVRTVVTEGYNHNNFGEFLSLRIGLISVGKGSVIFDNFIYKKIDL